MDPLEITILNAARLTVADWRRGKIIRHMSPPAREVQDLLRAEYDKGGIGRV